MENKITILTTKNVVSEFKILKFLEGKKESEIYSNLFLVCIIFKALISVDLLKARINRNKALNI